MRAREELAWAAGFIDGEGYFARPKKKNSSKAYLLRVDQTEKEPLDRLVEALGLGYLNGPYEKKAAHHKDVWCFSVTSYERVQAALAMLWPWLGAYRREQALRALGKV